VGRAASIAVALVLAGVLVAACGGSSAPPGVASLGGPTTTTATASGSAAASGGAQGASNSRNYAADVSYAGCMRTHGIPNWPDPQPNGGFLLLPSENLPATSSPQFQSANKACKHLLPNGGQPTAVQTQEHLAQALKLAQCMRSHGVANFPDPTESNGRISIQIVAPDVDPGSPQFQSANSACKKYSPGGAGLQVPTASPS